MKARKRESAGARALFSCKCRSDVVYYLACCKISLNFLLTLEISGQLKD